MLRRVVPPTRRLVHLPRPRCLEHPGGGSQHIIIVGEIPPTFDAGKLLSKAQTAPTQTTTKTPQHQQGGAGSAKAITTKHGLTPLRLFSSASHSNTFRPTTKKI